MVFIYMSKIIISIILPFFSKFTTHIMNSNRPPLDHQWCWFVIELFCFLLSGSYYVASLSPSSSMSDQVTPIDSAQPQCVPLPQPKPSRWYDGTALKFQGYIILAMAGVCLVLGVLLTWLGECIYKSSWGKNTVLSLYFGILLIVVIILRL